MNSHTGNTGLDVYLCDHLVGRLWLDEKRRFVFQYDSEWINKRNSVPLSLHLPLKPDIYADDLSRPFFSNLLPEAELKQVIALRLQISASNDFEMLNRIGGECAGPVSVLHAGLSGFDEKAGHESRRRKQAEMDPAKTLGEIGGICRYQIPSCSQNFERYGNGYYAGGANALE